MLHYDKKIYNMKAINDSLKSSLNKSVTSLVRCWKITTKDNDILGFTTSSQNLTYDGILYHYFSAKNMEKLNLNLDIKSDESALENIISHELINENDVISGKYNGAKIEIFLLDSENTEFGCVNLLTGFVDEIISDGNNFVAKVLGLKDKINKTIGDLYSPLCRANFCDKKCKLNIDNFKYNGTVIAGANSKNSFQSNVVKEDNYFNYGYVEFTSGKNIGQKVEIQQFKGGFFILKLILPQIVEINDKFNVFVGCSKEFSTCCEKFKNAINFRGEPHLPGINIIFRVV